MGMVEPGSCWEGVVANGDYEFENILSILDFPMESLEADDGSVGDWDARNSPYLGPIPSNVLMGGPLMPHGKLSCGPSYVLPEPPLIDMRPEQKQLGKRIEEAPGRLIPQNKLNGAHELGVFQKQSPVSVLEGSGSCSAGKKLPIKHNFAIPVRARSKRVRPPSGTNPWLLMYPLFASKKTKNNRERRKRSSSASVETVASQRAADNPSDNEDFMQTASSHRPAPVTKKCTHCEVSKTPQWREGPLGPKTLCNACGVRYRSGRLFPEYRPAASPTFIPSVHSNSHKKVIEMRNKAKIVQVPPVSPQPEFVPMSRYLFDYTF